MGLRALGASVRLLPMTIVMWLVGMLVALWPLIAVCWFFSGTAHPFLDHFTIIAGIGVVAAGLLGFVSYHANRPPHHKDHSGAAALVWVGGAALLYVIAYLVSLLAAVAPCMTPATGSETDWTVSATCKEAEDYARLYALLTPWQTGIGAGIGLLGVAWSTMYRSVYEDWVASKPKEYSNGT